MNPSEPPKIALEQVAVESLEVAGQWRVTWRIANRGEHALNVNSARVPHGQFKSAEVTFAQPMVIAPSAYADLAAGVHCDEPPGLVTENAFVILYVGWQEKGWRIYVRIRITVNDNGVPSSAVESITTQQAGFSNSLT